MNAYKSNMSLRAFYLFAAGVIWLGIWQTGFSQSSWILYVPALTFIFGGVVGYCPSLIAFRRVMHQ